MFFSTYPQNEELKFFSKLTLIPASQLCFTTSRFRSDVFSRGRVIRSRLEQLRSGGLSPTRSQQKHNVPSFLIVGMVKNIFQERLNLTEKLLDTVNSKEEFDYLLGVRGALQNVLYDMQLKGGVAI